MCESECIRHGFLKKFDGMLNLDKNTTVLQYHAIVITAIKLVFFIYIWVKQTNKQKNISLKRTHTHTQKYTKNLIYLGITEHFSDIQTLTFVNFETCYHSVPRVYKGLSKITQF